MFGSDDEPLVPLPQEAAIQMREATGKLRKQAWMVVPLTSPVQQIDREAAGVDTQDA